MDFIIVNCICNWCYPNYQEEIYRLASHIMDEKGCWKVPWTQDLCDEYLRIYNEYLVDKRSPCLEIESGGAYTKYVCKKHLLEFVVEKM